MKSFFVLNTFLLAAACLPAQVPFTTVAKAGRATQAVVDIVSPGQNCPVELSARRTPDSGLEQTSPADRHHKQGLRLSFKPTDPHGLVQANLTVHGIAGPQLVPAGERPQRYATENFHIAPSAGEDHHFTSTVYLKRLTGIEFVEVHSLRFADGTEWHSSAASACRVTPNGFRLVALGGEQGR